VAAVDMRHDPNVADLGERVFGGSHGIPSLASSSNKVELRTD